MTKTSTSFVCERFANLLLKTENNQFRVLHPVFFFLCFQGKNSRYDRKNAVYAWHTSRRCLDDFWWVGRKKLTFVNLVLLNMTFHQNFVVDERPTSFQLAFYWFNSLSTSGRQVSNFHFIGSICVIINLRDKLLENVFNVTAPLWGWA